MADYKLGAKIRPPDPRNIKLAKLWKARAIPAAPPSFNVDESLGGNFPTPMFSNDRLGCCVIAGQAHQLMRFEKAETGTVVIPKDEDVVSRYYNEGREELPCYKRLFTTQPDNGLIPLHSLKYWRSNPWALGGKDYGIHAFASIDYLNDAELNAAVYLLKGIGLHLNLPLAFQNPGTWDIGTGDNFKAGSWGGHYVYVPAYDTSGDDVLTVITWGRPQLITRRALKAYCVGAFALVQARNFPDSPIDEEALEKELQNVQAL